MRTFGPSSSKRKEEIEAKSIVYSWTSSYAWHENWFVVSCVCVHNSNVESKSHSKQHERDDWRQTDNGNDAENESDLLFLLLYVQIRQQQQQQQQLSHIVFMCGKKIFIDSVVVR